MLLDAIAFVAVAAVAALLGQSGIADVAAVMAGGVLLARLARFLSERVQHRPPR